jgi:histone H3/H4
MAYDSIYGLKNSALRRICLRAGIERVSKKCYEHLRTVAKLFLEELCYSIVVITNHARVKTVSTKDVDAALKIKGVYLCTGIGCTKKILSKCTGVKSKDVQHQQENSDCAAFQMDPVERCIREILNSQHESDIRCKPAAIEMIQLALEIYLVDLLSDCRVQMVVYEKATLTRNIIEVARRIRGERA